MPPLRERLQAARRAGRQLAGAPDRRKVALAAFVDELPPDERPAAFPDARAIADIEDPIGAIVEHRGTRGGFDVLDVRVPAGLVLAAEGAPMGAVVAAGLAAGDALAVADDDVLARARDALAAADLPVDAVAPIDEDEQEQALALVDLLVTTGAAEAEPPRRASEPAVCHAYVDGAADAERALRVCQAGVGEASPSGTDTILVHEALADAFLPALRDRLDPVGVDIVAGEAARRRLPGTPPASAAAWETAHRGSACGVRVVGSLDEALAHVNAHGGGLSETIVTREAEAATRFLQAAEADHGVLNGPTTRGQPPATRSQTVTAGEVDVDALTRIRRIHVPSAGGSAAPGSLGERVRQVLAEPEA